MSTKAFEALKVIEDALKQHSYARQEITSDYHALERKYQQLAHSRENYQGALFVVSMALFGLILFLVLVNL